MHKKSIKLGTSFRLHVKINVQGLKNLNVRLKLWQYWKYGRITIPYVDNNFANVRLQEFIEKGKKERRKTDY